MSSKLVCGVVAGALLCVSPAIAQEPASPQRPVDRSELRHQVYVMEGALARAVEYGAQRLNRDLRSLAPEMFLLAGDAQARGVYLEGYGVFFDVAVPMLRQSMIWSLRMMLQQDDTSTRNAIAELRRFVQTESNPAARQSLEAAIARLEASATPVVPVSREPILSGGSAAAVAAGAVQPPAAPPSPAVTDTLMDPNRVYTEAVQRALIDAMLDFSGPMTLGADEWLTVAARDNERRDTLAPQDPYEEVVTVLLRIKGSDLQEYRSGRIDKAEARKRVRVGEF